MLPPWPGADPATLHLPLAKGNLLRRHTINDDRAACLVAVHVSTVSGGSRYYYVHLQSGPQDVDMLCDHKNSGHSEEVTPFRECRGSAGRREGP